MDKTSDKGHLNKLLLIWAIAFIVRLIPVLSGRDFIDLYDIQAYPVLNNLNIYSATHKIFPYSPVSMFLPAACAILAALFRVPFYATIRIPGILADLSIAGALYIVLEKKGQKNSFLWALLYALNPISILIASFHGNIMPLPVLFTFLAYIVLLFGVERKYRLSALLLGLAIGLRGYPILLLPLFIFKLELNFKKKIEYLLYATVPTALSFIPFLIIDYRAVFREVFAYSGWIDYGFAAILRAVESLKTNMLQYGLPNNLHIKLCSLTKIIFFISFFLVLYLMRRKKLIASILAVFVTFYFVYSGVASQYFIWILPFAFLFKDRFLKYYLIFATWALLNFYLLYHPRIIFGSFTPIKMPLRNLLFGEIVSMSLLWLLCLVWIISLVLRKEENKAYLL